MSNSVTLTAARQVSLSITNSRSLLKLMSIVSVMPSNHLILCHPLLLLCGIFPSIRVFFNESIRIWWPKYWSFTFSIVLPMDIQGWFPLRLTGLIWFAVQETLKSLLQHHSSKASILWHSAFFMVQLSQLYVSTGKTIRSVQLTSHVWLCDPVDCSMPGFPVHHQLPELVQTHVHQVSDAIQPSRPLLSPSLPIFHLSQRQGLFQWVSSSHQVAKVLEFQLRHQSFQWIFRTDFL